MTSPFCGNTSSYLIGFVDFDWMLRELKKVYNKCEHVHAVEWVVGAIE